MKYKTLKTPEDFAGELLPGVMTSTEFSDGVLQHVLLWAGGKSLRFTKRDYSFVVEIPEPAKNATVWLLTPKLPGMCPVTAKSPAERDEIGAAWAAHNIEFETEEKTHEEDPNYPGIVCL